MAQIPKCILYGTANNCAESTSQHRCTTGKTSNPRESFKLRSAGMSGIQDYQIVPWLCWLPGGTTKEVAASTIATADLTGGEDG